MHNEISGSNSKKYGSIAMEIPETNTNGLHFNKKQEKTSFNILQL